MPLLVLDRVSKRFAHGSRGVRERVALRDVSLELEPGDLVAVWGRRRSGRSTLLRVAAGIEPPSEGAVRFGGADLARRPALGAAGGIGYCMMGFARMLGDTVLEHVAAPLLGDDVPVLRAQARAHEALRRLGAGDCAEMHPSDLDGVETLWVALARALVTAPRVLLIDEPTSGVPPASKRDELLGLLRSLAHDDGIAVLMTVDEASDMAGADRAVTIDAGELRGETVPTTAQVVSLQRNRAGPAA